MLFENKKGETDKWSLVAMVAIVAVVGMVVMFNGGIKELTGAVPAKVYDVSHGAVVGEAEGTAGICKYVGQDKLICPGMPDANTQLCLETASTVCGADSACVLEVTQECMDSFGSLDVSSAAAGKQADGTCGVAEAWKNTWGNGRISGSREIVFKEKYVNGYSSFIWVEQYYFTGGPHAAVHIWHQNDRMQEPNKMISIELCK